MRTLYFDCFAGASGNMILGALIALGVNRNELIAQIKLLDVSEFEIEITTKDKSGISAVHAEVKFQEEKAHRHLHTIEKIINDSRLDEKIKNRAIEIFTNLAKAEAKVHGIDIEKVHFHEVGAMDAIVDVVGACVGFELLEIEKFICSKIHVGSGFVKMAHGKYPVPPPAVAELLKGIPIYSTEIEGELITPTGAAIIATVCDEFGELPVIKVEKTAYGAGTREYKEFSNVLRLMLGEDDRISSTSYTPTTKDGKRLNIPEWTLEAYAAQYEFAEKLRKEEEQRKKHLITDDLLLIETNLDDISPQILGFVMERSFELGALDCWFVPIQMKKNRPATLVSILCDMSKRETLSELLFNETTTLGVRVQRIERNCLPREIVKVKTEFGEVDVKIAKYNKKIVNVKPEYEQIRQIALKSNQTLKEIEKKILEKLDKEKEI